MSTMAKSQKVLNYNILFPSEKIYRIITTKDQELRKLYSSYYILTLFKTVAYSEIRDNEAQFKSLLNRVEKEIDKIPKKVKIEHRDDEAFRTIFHGISCFLEVLLFRIKHIFIQILILILNQLM